MTKPDDDDRLMTRAEVAERFGLGKRFLELAAVKGGGPSYYKIGSAVRYKASDVRDWLEAQRRAHTSDRGARK